MIQGASNSLFPETEALIEEVALRILETPTGPVREALADANIHLTSTFVSLRKAEEHRRYDRRLSHLLGT